MTISFVGAQSVSRATSSTTYPVAVNAGVADDDMMIAIVSWITGTTNPTPPAGWNLLEDRLTGTNLRMATYWRLASSEPSSYTWTMSTAVKGFAWLGIYRGVDLTHAPVYQAGSDIDGNTTATTTPVAVPSGGWLVTAVGSRRAADGVSATWTSADTERLDTASGSASGQEMGGAVYDSNGPIVVGGNEQRTFTSTQSQVLVGTWGIALQDPTASAPDVGGRWGVHV